MKRSAVFLVVAFGVSLFGVSSAFAWTNPGSNPASGGGSVVAEQGAPGSAIYIKSNGNVGVGSANPGSLFQVIKAAGGNTSGLSIGSSVGMANLWGGTSSGFVFDITNGTINAATGSDLYFRSGGANTVFIKADGSVGIGNTNPTTKLDVTGTVKATGFEGPLTGTIASPNISAGVFGANTGGGNYSFPGMVGIKIEVPGANLHVYQDAPTSNQALFRVSTSADTSRFNVDEDGDVSHDGSLTVGTDIVVGGSDIYDSSGQLRLYGEDSSYLVMDSNAEAGDDQVIGFAKHTAAGTVPLDADVLMTIRETGNVGIGVVSPASNVKLQIETPENAWGLALARSGVLVGGLHSNGGILTLKADIGNAYVAVANNDNVGIGTSSPAQKLSVAGTIESTSGGIKFPDGTTQTTAFAGGTQVLTAPNVSSGDFGANTGGGNYSFPGTLAVGTTGTGTYDGVTALIEAQGTGYTGIAADSPAGSVSDFILAGGGVVKWHLLNRGGASGDRFELYAGAADARMTVLQGGNVGIGTTGPGQKLTVAGTIESTSGGVKFPDGTTQATAYLGGSQTVVAANVSAGEFGVNTGGGNYKFPAYVGIGVTASTAQLSLGEANTGGAGPTSGTQLLVAGAHNTGANNGGTKIKIQGYDNDGTVVYPIYAIDENDGVDFWLKNRPSAAGSSTAYFQGNVGIGTIAPATKLEVNGMITSDNLGLSLTPGDNLNDKSLPAGLYKVGTTTTGSAVPGASSTVLNMQSGVSGGAVAQLQIKANNTENPQAFIRHSDNTGDFKDWKEIVFTDTAITSSVSATNVSSGAFGANTGGGNYSFPANVGVGTASPTTAKIVSVGGTYGVAISDRNYILSTGPTPGLHVVAANNYAGDGGTILLGGSSGPTGYIRSFATSTNAGEVIIGNRRVAGQDTMYAGIVLSTSGNVGIGQNSPTNKLEVAGTVKATSGGGIFQLDSSGNTIIEL